MVTSNDRRHDTSSFRQCARRAFLAVSLVTAPCWVPASGCNSQQAYQFDSLDLVPVREEVAEVSLGKYKIPIPVIEREADAHPQRTNRIQLDFELHALVSRHQEAELIDAWKRHTGKLRDRVIRVCRNASPNELEEPELETLKTRLLDGIEAQLGASDIRQLVITEFVSRSL